MKNLLLFFIIFSSISINSQVTTPPNKFIDVNNNIDLNTDGYTLILNETFANQAAINNWHPDLGWTCGLGGDEIIFLAENRRIVNGHLGLDNIRERAECQLNGNFRQFSSGLVRSPEQYKYGIFEANVRVNAGKNVFAAFWLLGGPGGGSAYNEIDIFESGAGNWNVHTNHSCPLPCDNGNSSFYGVSNSLPGTNFSDAFVNYAVKWDPNKIIYYVNGQKVRTKIKPCDIDDECSSYGDFTTIPNVPMEIILNNSISFINGSPTLYLPNGPIGTTEVRSIRVWQKLGLHNDALEAHNYLPNVSYFINSNRSLDCANPQQLFYDQNYKTYISIDVGGCYFDCHLVALELYKIEANNCNAPIFIADGLIDLCPNNLDYEFDLHEAFNNLTLEQNAVYKLKIISYPRDPAIQEAFQEQYFRTVVCNDEINFRVNGIESCLSPTGSPNEISCPSFINIENNHGKPKIILDLSNVRSCSNEIFISIESSNELNQQPQTRDEIFKWLTSYERKYKDNIDIEDFCSKNNFRLEEGKFYRIKVATYSNNIWKSKAQLIFIEGCNRNVTFTLNDNIANIIQITASDELIFDASQSEFCSNDYELIFENISTNQLLFTESYKYLSQWSRDPALDKFQFYFHGRIDIKRLCSEKNVVLQCNNNYRLTLRVHNKLNPSDIIETSKTIQVIDSCDNNSDFMLRTDWCWGPPNRDFRYNDDDIIEVGIQNNSQLNPLNSIYIFSPLLRTCADDVTLTLSSNNLQIRQVELNYDQVYQMVNRGELKLLELFPDLIITQGIYQLTCSVDRPINTTTTNSCFENHTTTKEIHVRTLNCGINPPEINDNIKTKIELDYSLEKINANEYIVNFKKADEQISSIELFNLEGRLIKQFKNINSNFFSLTDERNKILIVKIETNKNIYYSKIILF